MHVKVELRLVSRRSVVVDEIDAQRLEAVSDDLSYGPAGDQDVSRSVVVKFKYVPYMMLWYD